MLLDARILEAGRRYGVFPIDVTIGGDRGA